MVVVARHLPEVRDARDEFDEVGAEIARALEYYKVPERERQEVLAAIAAKKTEVVNPSR